MKILFRKSDGRLLGAQAFGEDGVDKRISVLAAFLQMGATVYDLEEAELCYAPQFGSAKDPINLAGMVAANVLRGDLPLCQWDAATSGFLLDVREPDEVAVEHVPGVLNISLREPVHALTSCPAIGRSSSCVDPASGPIRRRGSSCSTGLWRRTCQAGCCRALTFSRSRRTRDPSLSKGSCSPLSDPGLDWAAPDDLGRGISLRPPAASSVRQVVSLENTPGLLRHEWQHGCLLVPTWSAERAVPSRMVRSGPCRSGPDSPGHRVDPRTARQRETPPRRVSLVSRRRNQPPRVGTNPGQDVTPAPPYRRANRRS